MRQIKTVDELIKVLGKNSKDASYLEILQSIDIPKREFEKYYTWKRDAYARNCLIKTANFELLLLCFEKGQETPIHDFDSKQAWVYTIQGKLKEERFRVVNNGGKLEQISATTLVRDDFSFMSQVGIHRYKNSDKSRSVSLNFYCEPIEYWKQYDKKAKATQVKVGYDAIYV